MHKSKMISSCLEINALTTLTLIVMLLITPLMSIAEIYWMQFISEQYVFHSLMTTPFIKASKGVLYLILVTLCFYTMSTKTKFERSHYFLLVFCGIVIVSLLYSFQHMTMVQLFSGIRWLLPIFICFALIGSVKKNDMVSIANFIFYIFWLHLSFQIIQLLWAHPIYSGNPTDFSIRNPGIFAFPGTAAFFTLTSLYFVYFFTPSRFHHLPFIFASCVSIILTASSIGLITWLMTIVLIIAGKKHFTKLILVAPILLGVTLLVALFLISNIREDHLYLFTSLNGRLTSISTIINDASWVSSQFGSATNANNLIAEGNITLDTVYASIIGNLSYIGAIYTLVLLALFSYSILRQSDTAYRALFLCVVLPGMGLITLEAFPMNFLLAFALAYHIAQPREDITYH